MTGTVFVAGATGAIGRPLCRLLLADGWRVVGTTRSKDKAASLEALGVEPVAVDVFDEGALKRAVAAARPSVVIHQLTDLQKGADGSFSPEALARNARIRETGTKHLVAAACAAGAKRIVAQSIAFAYAPGPMPYREHAPLNATATAVASLERQVIESGMEAVVLRYGRLYGPGTGVEQKPAGGPVHVDAAGDAARRAASRGSGIYNVAEDDGTFAIDRAVRELGWDAAFRIGA